jgi:hypothetical protein
VHQWAKGGKVGRASQQQQQDEEEEPVFLEFPSCPFFSLGGEGKIKKKGEEGRPGRERNLAFGATPPPHGTQVQKSKIV